MTTDEHLCLLRLEPRYHFRLISYPLFKQGLGVFYRTSPDPQPQVKAEYFCGLILPLSLSLPEPGCTS